MKKIIPALLIFVCVFLAGCANNDSYSIEKRFYQTQKKAERIFKNPDATPENELESTVGAFKEFINSHPEGNLSIEAKFMISRLYIVKKEYDKGRSQINLILSQHKASEPVCSEALFLKGNSYEIEDKWDLANAEYRKIINQYPLTLRGLSTPVYIAQHYKIKYEPDRMMEAYKEAIRHYKALISAHSDSSLAYTLSQLVVQCYGEIKDWQNAIATLEEMLDKYKDEKYKGSANVDAILMNIALIYKNEIKDDPKAKDTLERLLKDYPRSKLAKTVELLLKDWSKNE